MIFKIAAIFLLIFCIANGRTQTVFPEVPTPPNGCGSTNSQALVPNNIPLVGCQFLSACNSHDECYGRCETAFAVATDRTCEYRLCQPDSPRAGTAFCSARRLEDMNKAKEGRKLTCDIEFYENMITTNKEKILCRVFATIYKTAVVAWGGSSFLGITPVDAIVLSPMQIENSKLAVADFLNNASPEEIKQFESSLNQKKIKINFENEIEYNTAARILQNKE